VCAAAGRIQMEIFAYLEATVNAKSDKIFEKTTG
jgi:hypothetical protein